jgi:TBC1 domain family member 20
VYRLDEAGEEGMFHALLTSLPDLYEEEEEEPLSDDEKTEIKEKKEDSKILPELEATGKQRESLVHLTVKEYPADTQLTEKSEGIDIEDTLISNEESPLDDPSSITEPILDSSPEPESSVTSASYDATLVPETPATNSEGHKLDVGDIEDSFEDQIRRHQARVSLTSLLTQADKLYSRIPPSHPDLRLSSVMGPNSVVFTWSETDPAPLSDSEAEEIVDKPEMVVLPYTDPEERPPRRNERRVVISRKLRAVLFGKSRLEKRTILAGVVLVLGVVMATYGIRVGPQITDHRSHRYELRKLVRWVGGLLLGGWI